LYQVVLVADIYLRSNNKAFSVVQWLLRQKMTMLKSQQRQNVNHG